MKIEEKCSCGSSVSVEASEPLKVVLDVIDRWRITHHCLPSPWRTDPTGSVAVGAQLGFRRGASEVQAHD